MNIKDTLTKYKSTLKTNFKVQKLGVFGSYARGDENEKSDVDILIELSEPIGWEFIDLKEFIENILNKKVDLVTKKALKPQLRNKILEEVVYT